MWLPEWYCVKAVSYNGSIASIVHSSTLNGSASFEVTPIQPDTVYNISVTPCNMAGCNESCDVHSVQTESEMSIEGEMSKQNLVYIQEPRIYTYITYTIYINCRKIMKLRPPVQVIPKPISLARFLN